MLSRTVLVPETNVTPPASRFHKDNPGQRYINDLLLELRLDLNRTGGG